MDWRVSTAEVAVTPFAERYAPGASAAATLELVSTNDAHNEFYLTYLLDAKYAFIEKSCKCEEEFNLINFLSLNSAKILERENEILNDELLIETAEEEKEKVIALLE